LAISEETKIALAKFKEIERIMSKFRIEIKWAVIFAFGYPTLVVFEKIYGVCTTLLIAKQPIYTNFFCHHEPSAVFVLALLDKRK